MRQARREIIVPAISSKCDGCVLHSVQAKSSYVVVTIINVCEIFISSLKYLSKIQNTLLIHLSYVSTERLKKTISFHSISETDSVSSA